VVGYGKELIIDLHNCDKNTFGRGKIRKYFKELCKMIDMKRADLHFWDDYGVPKKYKQTEAHTKGTSAIQFILTSNITIHTLPDLKAAYINIFSCKEFDVEVAVLFTELWFKGEIVQRKVVIRK
jgi:S-adenosylmethionine decarboxylase